MFYDLNLNQKALTNECPLSSVTSKEQVTDEQESLRLLLSVLIRSPLSYRLQAVPFNNKPGSRAKDLVNSIKNRKFLFA
jgi:hypothetical protein